MFVLSCIAALFGATDWMIFFAIAGMLFSGRNWVFYFIPLICGLMKMPQLAVILIVGVWVGELIIASNRAERRKEVEKAVARFVDNPTPEEAQRMSETVNKNL